MKNYNTEIPMWQVIIGYAFIAAVIIECVGRAVYNLFCK